MPTETMKRELESLGIKPSGQRKCPRCGRQVEVWGSAKFNLDSHPTSPLLLHNCTEEDEPVPALPPIPVQRGAE